MGEDEKIQKMRMIIREELVHMADCYPDTLLDNEEYAESYTKDIIIRIKSLLSK